MHWVDRGPEPDRLSAIRSRFKQRWIDHYQNGVGNRPTDARWREFHADLSRAFSGLCAYCEEPDKGEVDHFRPSSKFPHLVYEWTNWIFACHNCNQNKSNKWPDGGYINPCAEDVSERPERFFDFNVVSGEIIPRADISAEDQRKARQMRDDLDLNATYHLEERKKVISLIRRSLLVSIEGSEERQEFLIEVSARASMLSSLARALLEEQDFIIED